MPHLEWMTRNEDLQAAARMPYRLLEEVPELSYTAKDPATENMLIQGDNLEALKSLLPFYAGQVKCIFIDPPYNTRSAFGEFYDDNLEHTEWLSMIYPRLELLRQFLQEDGTIWLSIDDNEAHYLKVLLDEVFGRKNFIANVVWQKRTSPDARLALGAAHDHLLVYAKDLESSDLSKLPFEAVAGDYKNLDDDSRGAWTSSDFTAQGWRPNQMYEIKTPSGRTYSPPPGRCWGNVEPVYLRLKADRRIWFGSDGSSRPRVKSFIAEKGTVSSWSWWRNDEVGHNQESKKEINTLFGPEDAFLTPKPERLVKRLLQISSRESDLVLDSFLGSGTTAAVAAKMGRRYIGIEMGGHAVTHCAPRLRKVIDGEQGGISESVGWKGGGGFRFYRLGKTIFDEAGQLDPAIRFASLAAHVWFSETRTPWRQGARGAEEAKPSPFLGVHGETAYYLLYNGVLGDKRPGGGNVITRKVLAGLPGFREHEGPKVIYGESSRLGAAALKAGGIVFKQTPYDVRAR